MLAEEDARTERRRSPRVPSSVPAELRSGDLIIPGIVRDRSTSGVFLATSVLIEVGERGLLVVGDLEVSVQVVWLSSVHDHGLGMGLNFEGDVARRDAMNALLIG